MKPYAEPEYRAAAAVLRLEPRPCWHGCGRRATSPDHVPPLAEHRHERGTGCCVLRPSCLPCQCRTGAITGNRLRRTASRTRLTPGSGYTGNG